MVGVVQKLLGMFPQQFLFHLQHVLPCAIRWLATRKMCVSTAMVGLAEGGVQYHVGGFSADAGKRFGGRAAAVPPSCCVSRRCSS